jgi:glucose-6-phosphate 1-dehydrogenase
VGNLKEVSMDADHQPNPSVFVIFGAAGDLTQRKLVPALYNLFLDGWMPDAFEVLGLDLGGMSDDPFRDRLRQGVDEFSRRSKTDAESWKAFAAHLHFQEADLNDAGVYRDLALQLDEKDKAWDFKVDRIFYLALPPTMIEPVTRQLAAAGLNQDRRRSRLVEGKPFGRDLASARSLNRMLCELFEEGQIFRIDHVQITVAEQVGVGHRGKYYDHAGAMRDMIQNHLLQILCLVAMEAPVSFRDNEIRNKKVDVLHAVRAITAEQVPRYAVRGQYGSGWLEGEHVAGYRSEEDVARDSHTETYAAIKLFVDNWRWQGVPFTRCLRPKGCLSPPQSPRRRLLPMR